MQESPPARRADEPLPEAHEVVPCVWKITLPIPFPLRTVNVYALVGKDGWVLIDAGMGMPAAREAFASGLKRAGLQVAT
jgi:glyoxylase-like metal-dependent hydrolase (beta-lactamase superfamily II)